jgi:hypothetical protein
MNYNACASHADVRSHKEKHKKSVKAHRALILGDCSSMMSIFEVD